MALHNDIGSIGENIAQQWLVEHGFAILATSYRYGRAEADIIAYQEGLIVFCEVKTRTSTLVGAPEDAVDRRKQRAYIRLANAYVVENHREEEVRFDIITVVIRALDDIEVSHMPAAFSAFEM